MRSPFAVPLFRASELRQLPDGVRTNGAATLTIIIIIITIIVFIIIIIIITSIIVYCYCLLLFSRNPGGQDPAARDPGQTGPFHRGAATSHDELSSPQTVWYCVCVAACVACDAT